MALSKPQLGIQSPILCQLCEQDPKISWKCLECDLLMCSVCKNNIHTKIKTAGEHKIIATKDIGKISSPNKDIKSESPSSQGNSKVDITLVEDYQTKLDGIFHLAISLDGTLWIGDGDHQRGMRLFSSHTGLQKVKCEGNKLKVKSSFNIEIYDMAFTPGNDLIILTEEPILKQIKSGTNKLVDTVYNVEPFLPLSIHVTRKNKTIVGTRWFKTNINTREEIGLVIVMDHDGNHENKYRTSFTYPSRITATSNDNIFVADKKTGTNEKIVVVLGQGDIINTYSGHSVINTEDNPFSPSDLATTSADNVIVADSLSSTLHILNSSGQLITYICLQDKGINIPVSIGLAMAGHFCMLYIGTPANAHKEAKLYKLNMIGC